MGLNEYRRTHLRRFLFSGRETGTPGFRLIYHSDGEYSYAHPHSAGYWPRSPHALVHLRIAVLRHHNQLHRPAGAGPVKASDIARSALDRSRFRMDHLGVSAGLCDYDASSGPPGGLDWAQARLRAGCYFLEPGGHEPLIGSERSAIRHGALCAGTRRVRQFPGCAPNGG